MSRSGISSPDELIVVYVTDVIQYPVALALWAPSGYVSGADDPQKLKQFADTV